MRKFNFSCLCKDFFCPFALRQKGSQSKLLPTWNPPPSLCGAPFPLRVTSALLEQIGFSETEWFVRSPEPVCCEDAALPPLAPETAQISSGDVLAQMPLHYKQHYLVTTLCHLMPFKRNRCYFCSKLDCKTSCFFFFSLSSISFSLPVEIVAPTITPELAAGQSA